MIIIITKTVPRLGKGIPFHPFSFYMVQIKFEHKAYPLSDKAICPTMSSWLTISEQLCSGTVGTNLASLNWILSFWKIITWFINIQKYNSGYRTFIIKLWYSRRVCRNLWLVWFYRNTSVQVDPIFRKTRHQISRPL